MGRPSTGCLSSFPKIITDKILSIRKQHSDWGPKTIWLELTKTKVNKKDIPKPSTIAKFLNNRGLVKKYEKHVALPGSKLHPAKYPHHIWQTDGQGATTVEGIGKVHLINTKDVHSKVYCGSVPFYAGLHSGSPSSTNYQQALRIAFCEFGMPYVLQTDHASVFFESKGKSPFPTRFHLWLVGLGISLVLSRKGKPTDQGIVERSHQTITKQVIKGNSFDTLLDLHQYCDTRREVLNEELPCSTIGNKAPLKAFPKAKFSGRPYHALLEAKMISLDKIYQFLAKGKWYRKVSKNKTLHLGGQYYYSKTFQKESMVQIHFEADSKLLVFRDVNEQIVNKQPIKGISIETLMGHSFFEATLPDFQLKLPLVWDDQLVSTTLVDLS